MMLIFFSSLILLLNCFLGFGDAMNCEENWKAVERYVDEQFNQYFQDESGLNRKNIQDHRVHCCLYFIPPYGHGFVNLDQRFPKYFYSGL